MLLQEFFVRHEDQRIIGDRDPLAVGMAKPGGELAEGRRLVRLENTLGDARGKRFDGTAEQHVDARIIFFSDDAR